MSLSILSSLRGLAIGAAAFVLVASAGAQSSEKQETVPGGTPKATTSKLQGEVIEVGNDYLIAKMSPDGEVRLFAVDPTKTAMIDGVSKTVKEIKPGTMLTAEITMTETPEIERTTTFTHGTVFWASPKSVIVTLEDGENHQYDVPENFKFNVNGKEVGAKDLKKGMAITGTKIVERQKMTISRDSVVTGTGPK